MTTTASEHSYRAMVERARKRAGEGNFVLLERDGAVATITLNEAEKLNPLSLHLSIALQDRITEVLDDPAIRVVILTGAGKAFTAGGDVRAMDEEVRPLVAEGEEGAVGMWRWIRQKFGGIVRQIALSDKIFIAAVNGPAAGVGLAFALASDVIVAAEDAPLVVAFGNIGLIPEVGTSWLLTRRLGYTKSFALYLKGEPITGRQAADMGLATEAVPADDVMARARDWAARAVAMPDHLVLMTKALLRKAADLSWDQALALEEFAEPMCFTADAHTDAVTQFLNRRK